MGNGDLPPQRPDQSYNPPPGGQAVAGQRSNIRARQVIIIGGNPPSAGLYVYNPALAFGDLIASIAANSGTDLVGDSVIQGIANYVNFGVTSGAIVLQNGKLVLYAAATEAGPWSEIGEINYGTANGITMEGVGVPGHVVLSSLNGDIIFQPTGPGQVIIGSTMAINVPIVSTAIGNSITGAGVDGDELLLLANTQSSPGTPMCLTLQPNAAADQVARTKTSADTNDRWHLFGTGQQSWGSGSGAPDTQLYRAAAHQLAADGIAQNISGSAEVWNVPTFANGWLNSTPGAALQYRRVAAPYNSAQFVGRLLVPAGVVAGQAIITALASAYRPTNTQDIGAVDLTTGAKVRLQIGTGGVLAYESGAVAGDIIGIDAGLYSLDA